MTLGFIISIATVLSSLLSLIASILNATNIIKDAKKTVTTEAATIGVSDLDTLTG
jgi:hypothetical protein